MFYRKTDRRIRFEQFLEGVKLMGAKKYGEPDGFVKIQNLILKGAGPTTSKTTVSFSNQK